MVKHKRKSGKRNKSLVYGIVGFMILLIAFSAYFLVQQTALGEEGYSTYDVLLASNAFDRDLWTSSSQYVGITVKDGAITQSAKNQGSSFSTKDLRLIDAKMSITSSVVYTSGSYDYNNCGVGARISSSKGAFPLTEFPCTGAHVAGYKDSSTSLYELTWDDYVLGHYQIKKNGNVIQEGIVPEGEEFIIFTSVAQSGTGRATRYQEAMWNNIRVKNVFDCVLDSSEGEVNVIATWDKVGEYGVKDLKGFKRFCPSIPALHNTGGALTSSKDVYYHLAGDEKVTISSNEYWRVSYIADRKTYGLNDSVCELYDVDTETCTGTIDACPNFVPGVGCVALVNDVFDLPVPKDSVRGGELQWTSYGLTGKDVSLVLQSGQNTILSASGPRNSCPLTSSWKTLDASCYHFDLLSRSFSSGDAKDVNSKLNVKLSDAFVQGVNQEGYGVRYKWTSTWVLDFKDDGATASAVLPESVLRGAVQETEVTVKNDLPFKADFILTYQTTYKITGEKDVQTEHVVLDAGGVSSVSMPLKTKYLGENDVTMWLTLQTDVGSIAFKSVKLQYDVLSSDAPLENGTGTGFVDDGTVVGGGGGKPAVDEGFSISFWAMAVAFVVVLVGIVLLTWRKK